MGLYSISAMAAILVNKLADFQTETGKSIRGCSEKNCEDLMNFGDWRAFTSILDMQIRPCLICKLADF